MQIEKRYTKREILTLYCNHIPWGHGIYGAEAAARFYFGTSAKDVTLEQAALLAGIVQLPARQSPYVNVEYATRRRNYVLQRMADDGNISAEQAARAKQSPGRHRRPSGLRRLRAVLRRGRAPAPRGAVRRQAPLPERPGRPHVARRGAAACRREGVRRRAAPHGQAAGIPRRHEHHRRRADRGQLPPRPMAPPHRRGRHRAGRRRGHQRRTGAPRAAAGSILARAGKYFVEIPKAGYAWTRKTGAGLPGGRRPVLQSKSLDRATQSARARSSSSRSSRARSSPSTTRPARSGR